MSLTDEPDDIPEAGPPPERPDDHAPSTVPSLGTLRWPIVQALRDLGRASDAELVEHVADSLRLTDQQRAEMVPSGQETRLRNRVNWATHELKQIGAVYYPEPSFRALTALGNAIDDDQIRDLHYAFEAEERRRRKAKKKGKQVPADTPTTWVIRAGREGERYDYNIEHGLAGIGYGHLLDLRTFSSRDELKDALRSHHPDADNSNYAGQLWRIRTDVHEGDLVVMPHKTEPHAALGTVTQEYAYAGDDPDSGWPHVVSVDWRRPDLPLTAIKEDLRSSLRAPQQSIFQIKRHDGSWRFQQLLETGQDPGARLDLAALVEQFRAETGYPTEAHEEQERLLTEWSRKLTDDELENLSRSDLAAITDFTNRRRELWRYVIPVEPIPEQIASLDDEELTRFRNNIRYLCRGPGELAIRFEEVSTGQRSTPRLSWRNVYRVMAVALSSELLPLNYAGRARSTTEAVRLLGLPVSQASTPQERLLEDNSVLRRLLEPHLGRNTIAMGAFLEWLLQQELPEGRLPLTQLADELLVGVEFLEDIVSLLEDKGQVILYGPPGTGKTYLARELARALAPDEACRALVQFHPSTSYEDCFEGYRPAKSEDDGGIRYELTLGPLARMAEQAFKARDRQHVMIIDEINRGNLPRVLGELLFLLEYRDEEVETLYRTEERFSLPDNLWFIGTMNTADRSIALVDAALRRRFHFVRFFPDSGPMAGLLSRWLEREGESAWIGDLVDAVNGELKAELEGSHLLLGPSHFMKTYGSSLGEQRQRLRRIWEYNIEPFIEDQFFGDPDQIERFRFKAVWNRHGPAAESDGDSDDPDSADDSDGEHAAADGEAAAEPGSTQPEDEQ